MCWWKLGTAWPPPLNLHTHTHTHTPKWNHPNLCHALLPCPKDSSIPAIFPLSSRLRCPPAFHITLPSLSHQAQGWTHHLSPNLFCLNLSPSGWKCWLGECYSPNLGSHPRTIMLKSSSTLAACQNHLESLKSPSAQGQLNHNLRVVRPRHLNI